MAEARLSGTRVALYVDHPGFTPDSDVVATTRAAARALSDAGLRVEECSPPGLEDVYPITLDYWRRPESDSPDEWVKGDVSDPRGLGSMTGEEVERSLFEWDYLRRRMLPFIAQYPLVLSPAAVKPLFHTAKMQEASHTHSRGAWSATSPKRRLLTRHVPWLLLRAPDLLKDDERIDLDRVLAAELLDAGYKLVQRVRVAPRGAQEFPCFAPGSSVQTELVSHDAS